MLMVAPRIHKTVSIEDQLDQHLSTYADLQEYKSLFGDEDLLTVFIKPQDPSGFRNEEVCQILPVRLIRILKL